MLPDSETFVGIDGEEVFRWSMADGRVTLGALPATMPTDFTAASPVWSTAISDDGNTIIGYLGDGPFDPHGGFMWTVAGGAVVMSSSDNPYTHTIPTALSSDGSVIVGDELFVDPWSFRTDVRAFRWTNSTGFVPLDGLNEANDVSADGSIVVGFGPSTDAGIEAVRWTQSTGAVELQSPPSSWDQVTLATFVSADGATIVGYGFPPDARYGQKMVTWTEAAGLQQLSTLGGDQTTLAVSADAKVILGILRTLVPNAGGFTTTYEEFIWTPDAGIRRLPELLSSLGLDGLETTGAWDLIDISGNGRIVFGAFDRYEYIEGSRTPTVHRDYWLLDISAVPEPSTLALCVLSLFVMLISRSHVRECRWRHTCDK